MEINKEEQWDGGIGFIRHIVPRKEEEKAITTMEVINIKTETGEGFNRVEEDSDPETDLEEEEMTDNFVREKEQKTRRLENVYIKACKRLKIIPCSPFLRCIHDEEIDLSHYNIGPTGAKAVAKTLRENMTTALLNVHDNGIGVEGARALADMLTVNCFITVLDLSMNFIKEEGITAFSDVLKGNKYLLELSLASVKLNDGASLSLGRAIKENSILRSLDLSSNEIGDEGGVHLAGGLKGNKGILFLNLSCNHIRGKGATAIANVLVSNHTLKTVDLSNNGFADYGTRVIGNALKVNTTLREIDVSQNRITPDGAWALGIGLEENIGLQILKVGGNPFQSRGAALIVDSLITNKDSTIEEIYLDDIVVSADFQKLLFQLFEQRRNLHVQFGAVVKGKDHRRRGREQKDLVSRILDHIELRGIRAVDFFRAMDKTGRLMITKAELIKGLKTAEIPMRRSQVDSLFALLDVDGNGFAQYREFVDIIRRRTHEEFATMRNNYQWNH